MASTSATVITVESPPFAPSLRAKRGNLISLRDCFVANAPQNDTGMNHHAIPFVINGDRLW
jgi:hypothetical protein